MHTYICLCVTHDLLAHACNRRYTGEKLHKRVNAWVESELSRPGREAWTLMVVGHSLGGALATLNSYELAKRYVTHRISLITFGSPRAVNKPFADAIKRLPNVLCYRVVNNTDAVTRVPPPYFGFRHVGHCVWLRDNKVGRPDKFGKQPVSLITSTRPPSHSYLCPPACAVRRAHVHAPSVHTRTPHYRVASPLRPAMHRPHSHRRVLACALACARARASSSQCRGAPSSSIPSTRSARTRWRSI